MPVLEARSSLLLLIDVQTGLLPAIEAHEALVRRLERLAKAARLLEVPVVATEHWPEKIGPTDARLQPLIDRVFQKTHFAATRENGFLDVLPETRPTILLAGAEAHVCVLQTGLGLLEKGFAPVMVRDGVGSRRASDREAAAERWAWHGGQSVTSEMVLFEWLQSPAHPRFREVLALIKTD